MSKQYSFTQEVRVPAEAKFKDGKRLGRDGKYHTVALLQAPNKQYWQIVDVD